MPGPSSLPVRRALPLLTVMTLLWGTNWFLFPIALEEVSVWTFRACSLPVSGLILLIVARCRGQSLVVPRRYWTTLTAASLAYLLVWNLASAQAASIIPSGQAAVLGFTMPLWAALFGWMAFSQRLNGRMLAAMVLGALSVVLLMVPNMRIYADAPLGMVLGLLAGAGWAVGTLILKRWPIDIPPLVLSGWQLMLASVPLAIGALMLGDYQWFMPSWRSILSIGYITLIPLTIGNYCWFSIVGMLSANQAGLASIMIPVVAMVTGALVADEPFGPIQILAMLCCVAALSLALLRPRSARR